MATVTGGMKQVEFSSVSCGDSARGLGQGSFAERSLGASASGQFLCWRPARAQVREGVGPYGKHRKRRGKRRSRAVTPRAQSESEARESEQRKAKRDDDKERRRVK
jgi:hypothetical protein